MASESRSTTELVQRINESRGCPHLAKASGMSSTDPANLDPNEHKAEYYHLLGWALDGVMARVADLRTNFEDGLVMYEGSTVVSAREGVLVKVDAHASNFFRATYWLHEGVHRTIDIATQVWEQKVIEDPRYIRLNQLVDRDRKGVFGNRTAQQRISVAANETVRISCSFQRYAEVLVRQAQGRPINSSEMDAIYTNSLTSISPLTQLHLFETELIQRELGVECYGGDLKVYGGVKHFELGARPSVEIKDSLAAVLAQTPGTFLDGIVGCPGLKYIPGIWRWLGDLSREHTYKLLDR
ncbi:hypothetical protein HYV86_01615 [Candidatus Woesearchaeota archaeon]|nr:hypothetical protein [Candidatus Woesearchaeota archaeon]